MSPKCHAETMKRKKCLLWIDKAKAKDKKLLGSLWYCNTYIYWQASNTAVHYAFISRGRGPPPDLFSLTGGEPPDRHDFFFWRNLKGQSDEEMVADREIRRPGGEFESTTGSVQGKDHERCKSIFHQPLGEPVGCAVDSKPASSARRSGAGSTRTILHSIFFLHPWQSHFFRCSCTSFGGLV